MINQILADAVLLCHLAFVAFAGAGALLVLRRPRLVWLHLPAAVWGAIVEFTGWICPLTPLENHFREKAGRSGYPVDFVEHYLLPLIYPEALTMRTQFLLGLLVVGVNAVLYAALIARFRRRRAKDTTGQARKGR